MLTVVSSNWRTLVPVVASQSRLATPWQKNLSKWSELEMNVESTSRNLLRISVVRAS